MRKRPSTFIRLLMSVTRIVLLTITAMALGMGVGLFAGIFGTIIASAIRHTAADMTAAYRSYAIPAAVIFGSVTLVYQVVREISGAVRTRT